MPGLDAVLDAAEGGDFAPAEAALATADRHARAAIEAARWLAGLDAAPPTREEARAAYAAGALEAARALVRALRWRALLAFDDAAMEECAGFADADIEARVATGWLEVMRGATDAQSEARLRALSADAGARSAATLVIELTVLRALVLLDRGDLAGATEAARRASRMASTEGRPQAQYLANVVLARLRRLADRPQLALRILAALRRVAPPPWWSWLAWELRLAGDRTAAERAIACRALDALVAAAREGDRAAFDDAARALVAATRGFCPAHRDAQAVLFCLDGSFALSVGSDGWRADAEAWRSGEEPMPPNGLAAIGLLDVAHEEEAAVAVVVAWPGEAPYRVFRMGLPLIAGREALFAIPETTHTRGRGENAAAALVLAGEPGLDEPQLFRLVYGFAFRPTVHAGILDVVLHRLRAQLGERGDVTRRGEQVVLRHRGLLIPDPRCRRALDDRVLAEIARQGSASAQAAAVALDLPLRTVQRALKRLSGDGLCLRERRGNVVEYRLEDTTFSEPTRH